MSESRAGVEINGLPVVSFRFVNVASRNKTYKNHFARGAAVKAARAEAFILGRDWVNKQNKLGLPSRVNRALIMVDVFCANKGIADIHNIDVKAILDGLVDCGALKDDEWAYVPLVIYRWAGIDDGGERVTWVHLFELGSVLLNGIPQALPLGRERIG